jgi:hypothetical protein
MRDYPTQVTRRIPSELVVDKRPGRLSWDATSIAGNTYNVKRRQAKHQVIHPKKI